EDELHNIVKEQTFLKDQEAAIDDLDDDQVALSELLDRLRHARRPARLPRTGDRLRRPPGCVSDPSPHTTRLTRSPGTTGRRPQPPPRFPSVFVVGAGVCARWHARIAPRPDRRERAAAFLHALLVSHSRARTRLPLCLSHALSFSPESNSVEVADG
ncbi:MAG: hypothetical protein BJ554DRAFT_8359, partial [Olpidium bornovanus]